MSLQRSKRVWRRRDGLFEPCAKTKTWKEAFSVCISCNPLNPTDGQRILWKSSVLRSIGPQTCREFISLHLYKEAEPMSEGGGARRARVGRKGCTSHGLISGRQKPARWAVEPFAICLPEANWLWWGLSTEDRQTKLQAAYIPPGSRGLFCDPHAFTLHRIGFPAPHTIPRLSSFASATLTRANSVAPTSGASVAIRQSSATPLHQLRSCHRLRRVP